MTPTRWQQVKKIMEDALEVPIKDQESFLEQACSSDNELKQEVLSLLTVHQQAGCFCLSPKKV